MDYLNEALVNAAENGQYQTVGDLLKNPQVDPKWEQSLALNMAARYGHVECVKLLVKVSNPMDDDLYAIKQAVSYGHLECVDALWPHLALTEEQTRNILNCLPMDTRKSGRTFLFVLDHSNLIMDEKYFFSLFAQNLFRSPNDILEVGRHFDIINNPNVLDFCERHHQWVGEIIRDIREQHFADQQHLTLTQALGDTPSVSCKKKM